MMKYVYYTSVRKIKQTRSRESVVACWMPVMVPTPRLQEWPKKPRPLHVSLTKQDDRPLYGGRGRRVHGI